MILIHITKENREPKVGEWYWDGISRKCQIRIYSEDLYAKDKALSLSVILDAPGKIPEVYDESSYHWFVHVHGSSKHLISNSEEIFQWLHDQGKLGEEWVEWPAPFDATWNGSPENGVFLFKTPYDIKIGKPESKDESWLEIFAEGLESGLNMDRRVALFQKYLEKNYHPPKRKEEK